MAVALSCSKTSKAGIRLGWERAGGRGYAAKCRSLTLNMHVVPLLEALQNKTKVPSRTAAWVLPSVTRDIRPTSDLRVFLEERFKTLTWMQF